MNVTTEKVAEGQLAMTIEVEPEAVEKAMNQAYHRLVGRTIVPGFRKGKAPRAMLERYLGRGALLEEALERLIPQVFDEAAKEQDITPFAEPKYEVVQVEPVIVKATVDLPPAVELGSYQDVRVSLDVSEASEEDVNDAIERVRESMATWEPAERPVEIEDQLTIDIGSTKDGEEFFAREDYPYSVRSENPVPVPGFAPHLVGMEKGSEKEFDISFPSEHEDKNFAGNTFHFQVKVKEIKAKQLPPLDDEFAKTAGEGLETVEDMRRRVRENLAAANERRAKEELVDKIIGEVVNTSKIEVPPSLIDHEVHHMIEDEENRFRRQRFSLAQYLNMIGKTPEQFHDELNPVAREKVRRSLALEKVAEAEDVKVDPAELDAEVERIVSSADEQADALKQFFAAQEGREALERDILSRKTIRRLVEIATEGAVSYPEITPASIPVEAEETAGTEGSEATQVAQSGEPAQE